MPTALSNAVPRARQSLRRLPGRVKIGIVIAVLAVAGLAWEQHSHTEQAAGRSVASTAAPAPSAVAPAGDYGDQPSQEQLPPPTVSPQAASMDAARVVAQRFAGNFASPNNNRDDWLNRISADVSTQLREQYQLTDIRNVNQATVTSLVGPLDVLPGAVAFRASYSDDSHIQMHLELELDGWKIVNVVPVLAAAPPAPGDRPEAR